MDSRSRSFRRIGLAIAIVIGLAGSTAVATLAIRSASSQTPNAVVDFSKVTSLPYYPVTPKAPDFSEPTCQAASNDAPKPGLPPLSCRISSAEPPPGLIPTASALQRPAPAAAQPDGATVIDNRLFRYTITVPKGWYSDMRAEGGTFQLTDPPATQSLVDHSDLPGGIEIGFTARKYVNPSITHEIATAEKRLQSPNFAFGQISGVIWDEGPGEGAAALLHAAFRSGDVIFEVNANVASDSRPQDAIDADIAAVKAVFSSITPY